LAWKLVSEGPQVYEPNKYVLQILWPATNNKAEYEALIHGLLVVASLSVKRLLIYGDSFVVIN